jgi:D-sedoheptulose 7-phosphate isomerase/D-glycero-D-manno-heptose 1,7-bisphosphate phosphatase
MSTVDDLSTGDLSTGTVSTGALPPAGPAKFPATAYQGAGRYFGDYARELARAAGTVAPASLDRAASILLDAYTRGARVFSCGNGGSAAIANHMQCDQVKGLRTGTDLAPRFVSLSSNVEVLTAIANDLAYEDVFTYQLQSQSEPGDVLVAVSSSGRSPNIVGALSWARDHGLATIALTGFTGGGALATADVALHVDSTNYGVVEDLHQALTHALAQYLRQSRMTPDLIASSVF